MSKNQNKTTKRSGFQVMARLIGLVKPLTGWMILAILMGLAGFLCASFITIFGGYAILQVLGLNTGLHLSLGWIFAAVLLMAAARAGLRYGEQSCNHFIAFKLLALIRDKVFQKLRTLAPAKLEGRDRGDLIALITSDIELLEVFYAHTISPIAIAILYCIIMAAFLASFNGWLGLLALGAYLVIGIVVPVIISRTSQKYGAEFRQKSGSLSGYILASLRGLDEILQYGLGNDRLAAIEEKSDELAQDNEQMKNIAGQNQALTNTLILLFDIAMVYAAIHLCVYGQLTYIGAVICTLAMFSSFGPVSALAALGSTLSNTFAAGNRVLDILDESPLIEEVTDKPEIAFEGAKADHVTFAYEDEVILDDFSLDIAKNQITGIVGKSGSGKSTLLKLLMRFWDPQSGALDISGENIKNISTANLRNMEGFVTQQTHLFHDSIKKNLLVAKPDATDEEIVEACKKASIHDFILTLPQGYDTPVGELGSTLSGGEKQRLGLARAFLHNAPFVLLDEPTSNLDSLNEAVILKSLDEAREGRTIVLVSHRKSTMGIADTVIKVENGRMS